MVVEEEVEEEEEEISGEDGCPEKEGERGGGWVEKGNFSPRAAKASAAVY